jgi:hypothetical protein
MKRFHFDLAAGREAVARSWPVMLAVAVLMFWLQAWGCRATMERVKTWVVGVWV